MNQDQLTSAVRTALKIIGTILATHGAQQAAGLVNSEDVIGLVLMLVGVIWSHFQHASSATPPAKLPALALIGALALTFSAGCSTNQTHSADISEAVVITSVNTGLFVWHDLVVAGKATQSQIDTVHKAYDAYYTAQTVAKAAIEKAILNNTPNAADVTTANQAVTDAEAALLAILNQYVK